MTLHPREEAMSIMLKGKESLRQSEADLQASMVQMLHLEKLLVFEFAKPGSRPRCPQCFATVGQLAGGVEPGFPDLLVIMPHWIPPVYIHIEVKVPGGKLSPTQIRVHAELRAAGANVEVAESLEQLVLILVKYGHRLRATL